MTKWATDRETLEKLCEVEPTRGSGPGGQHRNKVETGVRVSHPSGIVVLSTSHRSQRQNLDEAYERLVAKLEKLNFVPKVRRPTKPSKGAKRRRLDSKKMDSQKKASRRDRGD
jgi:ribosome-associated protein